MKNKYVFVTVMLIAILVASLGLTTISLKRNTVEKDPEQITVVTSFYPMYIASMNVVGSVSGINLQNLSEPQTGCLHDYQLTPMDMQLLSTADLFIINGGGIESFLSDVASAYPDLTIVATCQDIDLLETEGEENAHAWMSIARYEEQIDAIATALCDYDPTHSKEYLQNAADYESKLAELQEKEEQLRAELEGENVILFHEAFGYTADALGMNVVFTMDLDEERQVSAGEVGTVVEEVEDNDVHYIFAEESYGKKMAETVLRECPDVKVIYLDPLNRGDYDADAYLSGMKANLNQVEDALKGN